MRFPWKSSVLVVLALTAVLAGSAPASGYHQGTVQSVTLQVADNNLVLPINNYSGYTFFLSTGDSIAYSIQTITGGNIDLFFFNAVGLAAYRGHPPSSNQAISSSKNHQQFAGTFAQTSGSITVVLDNVNMTDGGARSNGSVTVQVGISKVTGSTNPDVFAGLIAMGLLICGGIIAAVVIVIVLIVVLVTRRQAPMMPPVPPPYMPPPQQPWPPQQPPQGGAPPGP